MKYILNVLMVSLLMSVVSACNTTVKSTSDLETVSSAQATSAPFNSPRVRAMSPQMTLRH
jgi:hypothetical protein